MDKKLYRSPKDGIVLGVASGLGRYFDKDPVIVRLIFVVLAFLTEFWPMLIVYAIMFFIIPVDPAQAKVEPSQEPKDVTPPSESGTEPQEKQESRPPAEPQPQEKDQEAPEHTDKPEASEETDDTEPVERMDSNQNM